MCIRDSGVVKQINFDIVERLLTEKKISDTKFEVKAEEMRQQEVAECTFKPQLREFQPTEGNYTKSLPMTCRSLGKHRVFELYSLAKPTSQRRDRSKGDIEYENSCDECTFAPKISTFDSGKISEGGSLIRFDSNKSVERMRKAYYCLLYTSPSPRDS
eukprot:TRINITY_DN2396_c0_g1_i2.p2 TRINITY_DN2396_c0_g1~~TRINITY_DN2396_c0_g1_i2.p2  ORF type:complete len:158 (+),score=44.80 TRINITY_DN2396_c0_g1_i2:61-534(+)